VSVEVDRSDNHTWSVSGELTFATVPAVQDSSPGWFDAPPADLDLGGIDRMDSAGIALVMEWARRAALAGREMRLVNVPEGLAALAQTTRLSRLLKIDGTS